MIGNWELLPVSGYLYIICSLLVISNPLICLPKPSTTDWLSDLPPMRHQTVCSVALRKSDGYGLLVSGKMWYLTTSSPHLHSLLLTSPFLHSPHVPSLLHSSPVLLSSLLLSTSSFSTRIYQPVYLFPFLLTSFHSLLFPRLLHHAMSCHCQFQEAYRKQQTWEPHAERSETKSTPAGRAFFWKLKQVKLTIVVLKYGTQHCWKMWCALINKMEMGQDWILFKFVFFIYCMQRWREWWQRRNVNGLPEGVHCLRCWEECSSVRILQVEVRPHLTVFLQRWTLLRWTEHAAAQQVTAMPYFVLSYRVLCRLR